jgi:hypothetical protein
MATLGSTPQPSGMDKTYAEYHVKRSTKAGGDPSGPSKVSSKGN